MTQVDNTMVQEMVKKVLQHVNTGWGGRVAPASGAGAPAAVSAGGAVSSTLPAVTNKFGQFTNVNDAVAAAKTAQRALMMRSLAQREIACELIRQIIRNQADELGRLQTEETKIGFGPHRPLKLAAAADCIQGIAGLSTECFSGDHGITLEEHAPWGVIGVITPVTHSLPTLAVNAADMITAGNSLVCNPHPSGKRIAAHGAKLFNQAIYENLGIDNLICVIVEPTLETANEIFSHPDVGMLCVTGGPGVVNAALRTGKRAVCAGPGNPPVVVDSSADLANAARCILESGSFDNNLLCLSEKEVFVEGSVFDAMMDAMTQAGAYRLTPQQMDQLASVCIKPMSSAGHMNANKDFVGKDPQIIAQQLGITIPAECRLLFGETNAMHPFVQAEQMMPVMPFVRCNTFEDAVDAAKQAEHGYRHTAIIHSRLVDHMTHMGKAMDTTLYIKNGPALAGNGAGGEGYGNFTIACATGEGICTPKTYTRFRRCTMVDNLRII